MDVNREQQQALAAYTWIDSQRTIFVLTFLLGAFILILLRESGAGAIISIAAAAAVMLIYAMYGSVKKFLMRPDILGDNLYYLGFLFTLVSLAYTLYKYSSNQSQIDQIIQNFGIALSTTLIGLVLRVYFGQAGNNLEQYEKSVQMSLTQAASNLIGEISVIRQDVQLLKTSIMQSVNEGVESALTELNESSKKTNESVHAAIGKSLLEFQDTLSKAGNNLAEASDLTNKAQIANAKLLHNSVKEFSAFADEFVRDLKALTNDIKNIESLDSVIKTKVISPLDNLQKELTSFGASLSSPEQNMKDFSKATEIANHALSNFTSSGLNSLINQITASDKTVMASLQHLESVLNTHLRISNDIQSQTKLVPQVLSDFENTYRLASDKIKEATTESNDSLLALEKSLIAITEKIRDGIQ